MFPKSWGETGDIWENLWEINKNSSINRLWYQNLKKLVTAVNPWYDWVCEHFRVVVPKFIYCC